MKAAPSSGRVFAVLAAGVLVISTASILIRWLQADGVPSLSIAAWRLGLAALLLAPLVLIRHRAALARLAPRDWLLAAAAGAFLAAHFATWIRSLEYTSVASSVALVTTNPMWIGIASWVVFRERLSAVMLFAIALAIAGSAVIFLADGGRGGPQGSAPALGNALAIVGSLAICGYLLIGRGLRRSIALVPYVGVVYAAAAVCLVVVALAAGAPLGGFARESWLMLLALAIGPQLLGHSSFNWALKYLSATLIALAILGEPIGSTILAWGLLGEQVGPVQIAGMALLLVGIFLAARAGAAASGP
ncbi:MAG TPA: DMT family transporter [Burkholderiales bacterium]|nr:DMT family transporter [Burkholderiales bacterium]